MKKLFSVMLVVIVLFALFSSTASAANFYDAYGLLGQIDDGEYTQSALGLMLTDRENGYVICCYDEMLHGTEYAFGYFSRDESTIKMELQDSIDEGCGVFKTKNSENLSGVQIHDNSSDYTGSAYLLSCDVKSAVNDRESGIDQRLAFQGNIEYYDVEVTGSLEEGMLVLEGIPGNINIGDFILDTNGLFLGVLTDVDSEDGSIGYAISGDAFAEGFPCLKSCYNSAVQSKAQEDEPKSQTQEERREETSSEQKSEETKQNEIEKKSNRQTIIVILAVAAAGIAVAAFFFLKNKKKDGDETVLVPTEYSSPTQDSLYGGYENGATIDLSPSSEANCEPTEPAEPDIQYEPTEGIDEEFNENNTEDINETSTPQLAKVRMFGKGGYFYNKAIEVEGAACFGRHPQKCNICYPLDEKGISSVHCILEYDGKTYTLTDLGSTYGTFVMSGRIESNSPVYLHEGDVFWLADEKNAFILR